LLLKWEIKFWNYLSKNEELAIQKYRPSFQCGEKAEEVLCGVSLEYQSPETISAEHLTLWDHYSILKKALEVRRRMSCERWKLLNELWILARGERGRYTEKKTGSI